GRGLYDVAGADRVVGLDWKGIAVRARQDARPHDRFDFPDDQCTARRRLCCKAGRLAVGHKMTMAGHWPPPLLVCAGLWQCFLSDCAASACAYQAIENTI